MARNRSRPSGQSEDPFLGQNLLSNYHTLVIVFLGISALFVFYLYNAFRQPINEYIAPDVGVQAVLPDNNEQNQPQILQRIAQSQGPIKIGIISGHRGFDSGAVCEDGLQEVDVNWGIAERVANTMRANNFQVDILNEENPESAEGSQMAGYSADVLVSIHADSCVGAAAQLSGYKTAVSGNGASSFLQQCVNSRYEQMTGLTYNANTVTNHMTGYYAFNRISANTPAIIIETGFMNLDRNLLVGTPDVPANAIAEGLVCFLEFLQ